MYSTRCCGGKKSQIFSITPSSFFMKFEKRYSKNNLKDARFVK